MWFCERCQIKMTPTLAEKRPRHECPAAPRSSGLGDVIAAATKSIGVKPCKPCNQRREKLNFIFPAGSAANEIYQALWTDKPAELPRALSVITATDSTLFAHSQLLISSLLATNDVNVIVYDLGLRGAERKWLSRYVDEVKDAPQLLIDREQEGWQTWNKVLYLLDSGAEQMLWLDADTLVTGNLQEAATLIDTGRVPLVCSDDIAHRFVGDWEACVHNKGLLKTKLTPINAGVLGFNLKRDHDLLNGWRKTVARAAEDDDFRSKLTFFDQGALALNLDWAGVKDSDLADPDVWNCGEAVHHETVPVALRELIHTRAKVWHYAGVGKLDVSASNKHLTEPKKKKPDFSFFLCGHRDDSFDDLDARPWITPIDLRKLGNKAHAGLAESRLLLFGDFDAVDFGRCVGVGSWQWNKKWKRSVAVQHLDKLADNFDLGTAYAPFLAPPHWYADSDRHHPGITRLLDLLLDAFPACANDRRAPLCNSVICDVETFEAWLRFLKQAYLFFFDLFGNALPFSVGDYDETRRAAYLFERVSAAWFAGREGLEFQQI